MRPRRRMASAVMICSSFLACSGSDASLFTEAAEPARSGTTTESGTADAAGTFSSDPVGTNAACVTATRNASLPGVNLVLMYDKSGSMGDPAEGGDPSVKWIPVNTGMTAFFSDPASSGYSASLQFFPAPGDVAATCAAAYATPLVPLTSLSRSQPLVAALNGTSPQGGTPTLPALKGAIAYAQQTKRDHPGDTTAVVLVTDGEPGLFVNGKFAPGCTDNDVTHVADAAAAALQSPESIATYVLGVGSSLDKLHAIAKAGGTNQAFIISVKNPTQTKTDLQRALEAIRTQVTLSCSLPLPSPPAGLSLDTSRVNVALAAASGHTTPLVYSSGCTAPNGWHYDHPAAPTRIELCASTCATAQADRTGKLTVALGCLTNSEQK